MVLQKKMIKSDIQPGYKSDHSLVSLIFKPFLSPMGRWFWKLNCSHLRDLEYTKRIKLAIPNTSETKKDANPNLLWDVIKTAVRGESIRYGAQRKTLIENDLVQIEQKIKDLEDSLKDNDDNQKWDQLYAYKENMNELVKIKTQGAIIRSRQQWYEEGEKNRYFLNLEKRNSNLKSINRLELNDNTITEDPQTILNEIKLYYKILYTKTIRDDHMPYLNKVQNIKKVNDEDFISMNRDNNRGWTFDNSKIFGK